MRTVAGLEDNTVGEGIFHAVTWTITLIGVARDRPVDASLRACTGAMPGAR